MTENIDPKELDPTSGQTVQDNAEPFEADFGHEEESAVLENSADTTDDVEHSEEELNLDRASVEELYQMLKETLQGDLLKSSKILKAIKIRYQEIIKDKETELKAKFLEEGGLIDDFEYSLSKLELELKAGIKDAFDRWKQLKLKREQDEQKNLSMKSDLIDDIKKLIEEGDISQVQTKFKEIQEKWNAIGQVPREKAQDLYNSYRHGVKMYYDALSIHRDLFRMELEKNLEKKEQIVYKVEHLLQLESIKKSLEYLQDLHKEWREIGPIPKSKSDELWNRFKLATNAVYQKRDAYFEKMHQQRKVNFEAKSALLEELEVWSAKEYSGMKEFSEAQKAMEDIDLRWRAIGRVPESQSEALWNAYRHARKNLMQKRQHLWDEMKQNWTQNLAKKMALIEKAEALSTSNDWKTTPLKFKKLQEEWKKIGAVQRDKSEQVWERFRAAADSFFRSKEEHFKQIPAQEQENLEKKNSLIAQIEAYVPQESLQDNISAMDAFAKAYRSIGFVPIAEKNQVEKAYEAACNAFWAKLNIDPAEKERLVMQNSIEALAQGHQPLDALKNERMGLRNRMEKLRQESMQLEGNLSFFGKSKNAEGLKKPYLDKIEKNKAELQQLEMKLQLLNKAMKSFEDKK